MLLKTILVDDEAKARENLRMMLEKHCAADVSIIGECGDVGDAYSSIKKLQPDLIFLDIELGAESAFDLLQRFTHYSFNVIFVTAYDQHAIQAIKCSALDYLLKPVAVHEITAAVKRAKATAANSLGMQLQNLFEHITHPYHHSNRIAIPVQGGYQVVAAEDIMYCMAEKEYTYLFLKGGGKICSSLHLGEYEDLLKGYDFFRVHHSYMVNRLFIQHYQRGEGGDVVIQDGSIIPVSRRKKEDFLNWLTGT